MLAPVLLVVARLLQGLSAGGEWSGSAAFMVEYAPESSRGLYGSWQQFSIVAGLLTGSAIGSVLGTVLSEDALNAWGWRIPFILGILVGLVGLYLRLRLEDTPAFQVIEEKHEVAQAPVKESFTAHWRESLTAIGFTIAWTVAYYILLTYMPTTCPKLWVCRSHWRSPPTPLVSWCSWCLSRSRVASPTASAGSGS